MDPNTPRLSNKEINTVMKDYQERADDIIRKMFNVLVHAHKKVDSAAYREWINKLKNR